MGYQTEKRAENEIKKEVIIIDKWAANCYRMMKLHNITRTDIAERTSYTKEYISMVMNGKSKSQKAKDKIIIAIKEMAK